METRTSYLEDNVTTSLKAGNSGGVQPSDATSFTDRNIVQDVSPSGLSAFPFCLMGFIFLEKCFPSPRFYIFSPTIFLIFLYSFYQLFWNLLYVGICFQTDTQMSPKQCMEWTIFSSLIEVLSLSQTKLPHVPGYEMAKVKEENPVCQVWMVYQYKCTIVCVLFPSSVHRKGLKTTKFQNIEHI